jgi:hypothetical protein
MAVNKNFVVKNGIEVATDLILANADTNKVGIGSTSPGYLLDVAGTLAAQDVLVSGSTILTQDLQVGTSGSIFYVSDSSNAVGVGTSSPEYLLDVRSSVSTGQTALYVYGDLRVTGDINVDDLILDDINATDLHVSGLSTFVGVVTTTGDLYVGGDLYVKDDVTYDEVNGRNLSISGIATIASLEVTGVTTAGIVTGATYYGDGSNLTGVSTSFTGSIGIQSGGTVIGTGITMLNITGGGSTVAAASNVATIVLPENDGVSIGMVIALS